MFKPTKRKLALFVALLALSFSPMLFTGSGVVLAIPVLQIFWLSGFAKALGIPVTAGPGVDAFSLVPPNTIGYALVMVGTGLSLAVHYALACVIIASVSGRDGIRAAKDHAS
jgi:hypothetical protein